METFNETCKNYALAKNNRHINRMKLDSANSKTKPKQKTKENSEKLHSGN